MFQHQFGQRSITNLNLVANVTWHSSKQHSINVHHNNEHCKAGQSIAAENRAAGTGGRPLCGICKRPSKTVGRAFVPKVSSL